MELLESSVPYRNGYVHFDRTASKPPSPEYNIRNKREWNSVYQVLENARSQYQSKRGAVGKLNFHLRKGADNIAPTSFLARTVSKFAPERSCFRRLFLGPLPYC